MKKYITLILMLTMCGLCLAACGQAAGGSAGLPESAAELQGTLSGSPPILTITCGSASIEALTGGYNWEDQTSGELNSAVIACSAHPLQCRDITPVLTSKGGDNAVLSFGDAPVPDELTVVRYDGDAWDDVEALSEAVDIMASFPPQISLAQTPAIYVINARWQAADGYGGSVEYSFCTD